MRHKFSIRHPLKLGDPVRVLFKDTGEQTLRVGLIYGEKQPLGDTELESAQAGEDLEHLRDMASEAPVIRLVNAMIAQAVEKRASDIHIEPFEKEFRVRYRVDGVLFNQEQPPREMKAAIQR